MSLLQLSSSRSIRVSLNAIHNGDAGLNKHRAAMLSRIPDVGDWARFPYHSLEMLDLAFLTAYTGHEFAILRGKKEDILVHGDHMHCVFEDILVDMLYSGKLEIYGHSHPGEEIPSASSEDRDTLLLIGQKRSRLISGYSGIEIIFSSDPFELL